MVRKFKISCGACRYNKARLKGDERLYKLNCTPAICPLYAAGTLENVRLWDWFEELITWQFAGLMGRVDRAASAFDLDLTRAFVTFRAWYLRPINGEAEDDG